MAKMGGVNRRRATKLILLSLLALFWPLNIAKAAPNLNYHGGQFKNYVIDLIFHGSNFTNQDRQDVIDYVTLFAYYVNGYETPAGSDPAVRYYGLWGIVPGLQISDNGAPPVFESDSTAAAEVRPPAMAVQPLVRRSIFMGIRSGSVFRAAQTAFRS